MKRRFLANVPCSMALSVKRVDLKGIGQCCQLLAWLRLLALGGRQHRLNIQASWPCAADIVTAWDRISALPHAP